MFINNPWMESVLNEKNPKGYNKYLKQLVKQRASILNIKQKKSKKSKTKK